MIARRSSLLLALALLATPLPAPAQMAPATPRPAPTAAPAPSASEAAFLTRIMTLLPQLYPTPATAMTAGYVRYTNEDRTGAISYVDPKFWNSTDVNHPSQLWYDVRGRLIGADYSVPFSVSASAPSLLGISASRFHRVPAHIHYVVCNPPGSTTCVYGRAIRTAAYAEANGGDFSSPTAEGLVRAHAPGVTSAANVRDVVLFPGVWDVPIWVIPNPLGQFADPNPNVVPSRGAGPGESNG